MGGAHDGVDVGMRARDSEQPSRARSVGDQHRGVALTPRGDAAGHVEARHPLFHRIHDLPNRESASGAEIDRDAVPAAEQVTDGGHVRIREVGDVDVVAYGGAVRGRQVVAENGDLIEVHQGGEDSPRDEMGFGIVALTDLAVRVAAAGEPSADRRPLCSPPMRARQRASCVRRD